MQNGDENDENGLSGNSSNTLCAPNQGCRELQIGLENSCEEEGVEQYCGEGLLSLGERERPTAVVSGGAWVAQARRGCVSGCGAAAQEQRTRGVWACTGGGAVE